MASSETSTNKKNQKKDAKRKKTDSEVFKSDSNEDVTSNIILQTGLKSIQDHAAALGLVQKAPDAKAGVKKKKAVKRKLEDFGGLDSTENGETSAKIGNVTEDAKKARAMLMVSDLENVIKISFDGEVPDEVKQKKDQTAEPDSNDNEWTAQDITDLMVKMEEQLPSTDVHNAAYRQERLDWSRVASEKHPAEICKAQWESLSSKVMKYRTLSELIVATRRHILIGDNLLKTHRSFPKKPASPFMAFFTKNREKFAEQNPELNNSELAKFAAKKYDELSERKKEKYKRKYKEAIGDFHSTVEMLRRENPHLNPQNYFVPTRPLDAQERYVAHMVEKRAHKHPGWDHEQLQEHFRSKWEGLSDEKKSELEQVAAAEKEQYAVDLYDFFNKLFADKLAQKSRLAGITVFSSIAMLASNGLTAAQRKQEIYKRWKAMTKEQQEPILKLAQQYNKILKKSSSGAKKEKPTANAYNLFISDFLPSLVGVTGGERMQLASQKWKSLSEADRSEYKRKAAKLKKKHEKV